MQKFGTNLARLDWDVKAPDTWAALAHGDKKEDITQVGSTDPKSPFKRFYDGNAKSWAKDIHPDGTEQSSWVSVIDYDSSLLELKITFRDGTTCLYKEIPPEMAEDFSKASSKGRWVHNNLVVNHHDYSIVHAGAKAEDIDLYHRGGLLGKDNATKTVDTRPTTVAKGKDKKKSKIGGGFDDYLDDFFGGAFEGFGIN